RKRGGHAMTIGISMLAAVPAGVLALTVTWIPGFLVLTAATTFLLSIYNGPAAAVVDEMGPPQYSATLQAVCMFSLHVFGNSPAPSIIGRISDQLHCSIAFALQAAIVAFGISGVLFLV